MRPTTDIRPLTLTVRGPLATIAKVDAVTCQADHGWTPKGWAPAVRPLSRRNACAALVSAIHASDEPRAVETWQALCAADASAMLAVALALPIWARPGKVVEGWNMPTHADHGCRTMVEGAIVAEVARLTAATIATMDAQAWEACQPADTGKGAPFPTAKPGDDATRKARMSIQMGKPLDDASMLALEARNTDMPAPAPVEAKGKRKATRKAK